MRYFIITTKLPSFEKSNRWLMKSESRPSSLQIANEQSRRKSEQIWGDATNIQEISKADFDDPEILY